MGILLFSPGWCWAHFKSSSCCSAILLFSLFLPFIPLNSIFFLIGKQIWRSPSISWILQTFLGCPSLCSQPGRKITLITVTPVISVPSQGQKSNSRQMVNTPLNILSLCDLPSQLPINFAWKKLVTILNTFKSMTDSGL